MRILQRRWGRAALGLLLGSAIGLAVAGLPDRAPVPALPEPEEVQGAPTTTSAPAEAADTEGAAPAGTSAAPELAGPTGATP